VLAPPAINVENLLTKIRVSRLSLNPLDGRSPSFDLSADFREISRAGGKVKLRYSLTVDTFPLVERAGVEGFAIVDESLIVPKDQSGETDGAVLDELAVAIFRSDYESLYLLFDTLRVASPSPWLVREVRLVK